MGDKIMSFVGLSVQFNRYFNAKYQDISKCIIRPIVGVNTSVRSNRECLRVRFVHAGTATTSTNPRSDKPARKVCTSNSTSDVNKKKISLTISETSPTLSDFMPQTTQATGSDLGCSVPYIQHRSLSGIGKKGLFLYYLGQ